MHPELPLSKNKLRRILRDILHLYPECDSIFLVGTYARLDEVPSTTKGHDVDILIHFPSNTNRTTIERRPDGRLWRKWSGVGKTPIIDFLFMFGDKEPGYGQHIWRLSSGLKTPKLLIWSRS